MIDKMSNQGKIGFLFGEGKLDKLNNIAESAEKDKPHCISEINEENKLKETIESQRTKRADHHDMISRGTKIMSATGGNITDMGGPKKYMKSQTSNSIFDSDVLERLSKKQDSSEKTKEIKANINKVRNSINKEIMNELTDSLKDTDQRKSSNVSSLSEYSGSSSYKRPVNGLSIFDDNMNFDRVPEKTAGEILDEKIQDNKSKVDDSWKNPSRNNNMRYLEDRLMDSFINREKNNEE